MKTTTTTKKAAPASKSALETTVELDAVLVAKIRASLRAVGLNIDIGEHIEKGLESELEENSGFFEAWIEDETTPHGREIEDKLERIRNGDKRLVRPEPLPQAGKLPIMFPAEAVQLLEELLKASGTRLSTADYAKEYLQQEIIDSLNPLAGGVPEFLKGGYELEPEDVTAMEAVVARWKAKQ